MKLRRMSIKLSCAFSMLFLFVTTSIAQIGEIIWQETFDTFNPNTWNIVEGDGCADGPDMCGWGNFELQNYQSDNVYIEDIFGENGNKALVIEARRENVGSSTFTSGKIDTENNLAIKYGLIEVRMKVPDLEVGLWPAAWLLGANHRTDGWPKCGEIDMMEMGHMKSKRMLNKDNHPLWKADDRNATENEYVGSNLIWYADGACSPNNLTCAASIAFDDDYKKPYVNRENPFNDRFMTYRMYWDPSSIRFTVIDNGIEHDLYTGPFPISEEASAFRKPFYFILNLAVGGAFTDATNAGQVTADLPAKMYVDYVQVRKWNGHGEVYLGNDVMAHAGIDQTVNAGTPVVLNAGASYGPITSYIWTKGGAVVGTEKTIELNLESGFHNFVLTVADASGNTSTDDVVIKVGAAGDEIGEVIWEETFDTFNQDWWNYTIGDGCDQGPNMCGWGNQELQYYLDENVYTENGHLVIEAKRESLGNSSFTSGKIDTEGKVAIKYGMVEVRMQVPNLETGLWPAAWLLGVNHKTAGWPYCGEMDMMEMGHNAFQRNRYGGGNINSFVGANLIWYAPDACGGDNLTCAASMAWDPDWNRPYFSGGNLTNRFLTYRMYWNENLVRYTVIDNGVEHRLYGKHPDAKNPNGNIYLNTPELVDIFQKPFYFILNMAVGGNFTDATEAGQVNAPLPAKMLVDYVRVHKWRGQGEVITSDNNILANAGGNQVLVDEARQGRKLVKLDGSGSYGDISNFVWSKDGMDIAIGQIAEVELPTGTHSIKLTVTGSNGQTHVDDTKVEIREIIWEETFDTFNSDIWNTGLGDGCDQGDGMCGWGNQELQYYHANNVRIENIPNEPGRKALVLEAKNESMGESAFTSGKVDTKGNLAIKYGLVEVRMMVPDLEKGLWPAAWLLGVNQDEVGWPHCGEIDMMEMGHSTVARQKNEYGPKDATENEYVGANLIWYSEDACSGANPTCAASIAHDAWYKKPYVNTHNPLNDRFMTYRMYWDPYSIRLTVVDNGNEVDLYTNKFPISEQAAAFKKPFYFLLNLAVGGNFTDVQTNGQMSAPLPAKMYVDYVRVMKYNGYGAVTIGEEKIFADAGSDIIVNLGSTIYLDGTGSTSMVGEIISYKWSIGGQQIANGRTASVNLPAGIHVVQLEVEDEAGNIATDEVNVAVGSFGGLIANAGNNRTIDIGQNVILDGSNSSDPEGEILSYEWSFEGRQIGSGATIEVSHADLSMGANVFTLTVTNDAGDTATANVTITVIDAGVPVADAGSNQTLSIGEFEDFATVTLNGSGSYDPDGVIDSYVWTTLGSQIASGVTAQIQLPVGRHKINLIVTDNEGKVAFDVVEISVSRRIGGGDLVLTPSCVSDFTVRVSSDENNPTLTFIPSQTGIGEGTLLLFYDTDRNKFPAVGANHPVVNVPFQISASKGQIIYFSYTYSTPQGERNILSCLLSFEVGTSSEIVINPPVAKAGPDQIVKDENNDGKEWVTLDGSGSSDAQGQIVSYSWILNGSEIATGVSPSVELPLGIHEIHLKVTNDQGLTANDEVIIEVYNDITVSLVKEMDEVKLDVFSDGTGVFVNSDRTEKVHLRVINIAGQLVHDQKQLEVYQGTNTLPVNLSKGVYLIWLNTDTYRVVEKVGIKY